MKRINEKGKENEMKISIHKIKIIALVKEDNIYNIR